MAPGQPDVTTPAQQLPADLADVGFDQRLGETLPTDLVFADENGEPVRLGDFLGDKPLVLVPVYFDCPMLCTLTLQGVAGSLRELQFSVGEEFQVVVFSFDPRETPEMARGAKATALARYGRPETADGWHFLTGEPEAIDRLTEAIGFRYAYDERDGEFAHTAGLVVVTPEGKLARYFFGVDYHPRDMRLALVDAADGEIGSVVDEVLLFCFQYDPATGKYSSLSLGIVRLAGGLTVLALVVAVLLFLRWERHRNLMGTT
jgi:protein SCO1/2